MLSVKHAGCYWWCYCKTASQNIYKRTHNGLGYVWFSGDRHILFNSKSRFDKMPGLNLETISRQFSTRLSIIYASLPFPHCHPSILVFPAFKELNPCPCPCGSISTTDAVCIRDSLIILANAEKVTLDRYIMWLWLWLWCNREPHAQLDANAYFHSNQQQNLHVFQFGYIR